MIGYVMAFFSGLGIGALIILTLYIAGVLS